MTAPVRVLSVGHVTHDVYPEGIVPGGCAYYGARVYEALGAQSSLFTAVGDDFRCQAEIQHLVADCTTSGATTCFRNVYPPNSVRVQRVDAQGPMIAAPGSMSGYDVVHLAPVMNEVNLGDWVQSIETSVCAISVQGWIKKAGAPFRESYPDLEEHGPESARSVVQVPWTPDEADLRRVGIASLGAEDLVGQGDLLERLIRNIPVVACTHGTAGADVYIDGRPRRVGIYPATEVDPTGAGDTFAAGFIYGVSRGDDPVRAACLGAAAAAIVVEGVGGQTIGDIRDGVADRVDAIYRAL